MCGKYKKSHQLLLQLQRAFPIRLSVRDYINRQEYKQPHTQETEGIRLTTNHPKVGPNSERKAGGGERRSAARRGEKKKINNSNRKGKRAI